MSWESVASLDSSIVDGLFCLAFFFVRIVLEIEKIYRVGYDMLVNYVNLTIANSFYQESVNHFFFKYNMPVLLRNDVQSVRINKIKVRLTLLSLPNNRFLQAYYYLQYLFCK